MNNALFNGEVRVATIKLVDAVTDGRLVKYDPVGRDQLYLIAGTNGSILGAAVNSLTRNLILREVSAFPGMRVHWVYPSQGTTAAYFRNEAEARIVSDLVRLPLEMRLAKQAQLEEAKYRLGGISGETAFWREEARAHNLLALGLPASKEVVNTSDVIRVCRAQNPELSFNRKDILDRWGMLVDRFLNRDEVGLREVFGSNPYSMQ